jgi:hypothetical protein
MSALTITRFAKADGLALTTLNGDRASTRQGLEASGGGKTLAIIAKFGQ